MIKFTPFDAHESELNAITDPESVLKTFIDHAVKTNKCKGDNNRSTGDLTSHFLNLSPCGLDSGFDCRCYVAKD